MGAASVGDDEDMPADDIGLLEVAHQALGRRTNAGLVILVARSSDEVIAVLPTSPELIDSQRVLQDAQQPAHATHALYGPCTHGPDMFRACSCKILRG
jgi:hypothetical protein